MNKHEELIEVKLDEDVYEDLYQQYVRNDISGVSIGLYGRMTGRMWEKIKTNIIKSYIIDEIFYE